MQKSPSEIRGLAAIIAHETGERIMLISDNTGNIEFVINVNEFTPPLKTVSEEVRYLKVEGQDISDYIQKQTIESYKARGIEHQLLQLPIVEYKFSENTRWTIINRVS